MTIEIDTSPKRLLELAKSVYQLSDMSEYEDVLYALAAEKEAAANQEPVIWAIAYNNQPYSLWHEGDGALLDCEVRRQGGTCHKMPLYLAPQPAPLPTDDLGTYYVSGPYHDGSMAVCRLDTGLVVHKFRLDGVAQPAPRPTAAEVQLPEPAGQIVEHGLNRSKSGQVVTAVHDAYTADQLRNYAQAYADAVVAAERKVAEAYREEGYRLVPDKEYLRLFEQARNGSDRPSGILRGVRACIAAYEMAGMKGTT